MFREFTDWCVGERRYKIAPEFSKKAACLLVKCKVESEMRNEGGRLVFSLPLPECRAFESVLTENGIVFSFEERGARRLFSRYKRRPGIIVGLILFTFIILSGRSFVWDIEVCGNDELTANEIISELSEHGFGIGTYIPGVDFDKLHSDFLQSDRRVAWIAVNMLGTHAKVELRESLLPEKAPDENLPRNLVADEDGIIESVDIYRGTKVKSAGEPVRAGELLASGIVEIPKGPIVGYGSGEVSGFRLVHARGVVMASVKRGIKVEIPLEYEKKVRTGKIFREISIKILRFSLKIFKNTGNLPTSCDIIERERKLCFFGRIEVPVTVCEKIVYECETKTGTLTPEEARKAAFEKLRGECAKLDGELLSREVNAYLDDEKYVIDCRLRVLRNIAREAEILTDKN